MALRPSSAGSGRASTQRMRNCPMSTLRSFAGEDRARVVLWSAVLGASVRPTASSFNPGRRRDGCLVGISRQTVAHTSGDHRSTSAVETARDASVGRASVSCFARSDNSLPVASCDLSNLAAWRAWCSFWYAGGVSGGEPRSLPSSSFLACPSIAPCSNGRSGLAHIAAVDKRLRATGWHGTCALSGVVTWGIDASSCFCPARYRLWKHGRLEREMLTVCGTAAFRPPRLISRLFPM
jgi:hypothetical protein